MKSIREIYKIGKGPSSSHTMGPERAAKLFRNRYPQADAFEVVLYGSLSKTGVGHGTDRVIREVLSPLPTTITFSKENIEASHPNTLDLHAYQDGVCIGSLRVESVGGGDIRFPGSREASGEEVYIEHSFAEIVDFFETEEFCNLPIWYDKERKDQVGEVVYIDVIEDCDGDDEFGSIMWNVFFCDVKFSDGVVKCYRDCRLKKVK